MLYDSLQFITAAAHLSVLQRHLLLSPITARRAVNHGPEKLA
jgi:hypothetical protein